MSKKVFLFPCDSFLGRNLGAEFQERGYEVLGAFAGSEAPSFASTSYKIGSDKDAVNAQRQFLQIADVVVFELLGNEKAARDAAVQMASQPFGGREQTLIGVSTPLTWAATRPVKQPVVEAVTITAIDDTPRSATEGGPKEDGEEEEGAEDPFPPPPEGEGSLVDEPTTGDDVRGTVFADVAEVALIAPIFRSTDFSQRVPCLAGQATWEVENVLLRSGRRGKLRTHVICPGFLYGQGEDDAFLFPLFRDAWAVARPLPIFGSGANKLPLMHVRDMAAYCASVASLASLEQLYILASDSDADSTCTQENIIKTIGNSMGKVEISYVPIEESFVMADVERFTVDFTFSSTILPDEANFSPNYSSGFLANVDKVVKEFQAVRYVTPLRLVLLGPPAAGKSTLGARLAKLYGLRHISAKDLIAAALAVTNPSAPPPTGTTAGPLPPISLEPELAKAIGAELANREARLSIKNISLLLKAFLSLSEIQNRGYVLDSLPKSMATAKFAFMQVAKMSEEEMAENAKDAAAAAAGIGAGGGAGGKVRDKAAAPAKGGGGGKGGRGGASDGGPEVPEGYKLEADPTLAPTHVIDLQSSEEELKARLKVLEVAEVEFLKKSTPLEVKGAKATKAPVVGGHNNEKDLARRLDLWKKSKDEAEEDLKERGKAVQLRWDRIQAEKEAEQKRSEAEAQTLRAKRRRAKLEAEAAAATAAVAVASGQSGEAAALEAEAAASTVNQSNVAESAAGPGEEGDDPTEDSTTAELEGPVLPKYGGMVGVMVQDIGALYIQLSNDSLEECPKDIADMKVLTLPVLEASLRATVGLPHNFDGFPNEDEIAAPSVVEDPEEVAAAAAHAKKQKAEEERIAASMEALEVQEQEAKVSIDEAHEQQNSFLRAPLQQWLMSTIMPTITKALNVVAKERARDPLRTVARFLLDEAERLEGAYVDPYDDSCYEVQIAKIAAKSERDTAREVAAHAKAERELAAKVAAMEAEQHKATEALNAHRAFSPSKSTRRHKAVDTAK